jgi:hypothetical protein
MAKEETSNNGSALARAAVTSITKGAEHETAITAAAAQAQAIVQARYLIAYQRPRDIDETRVKLLKACQRPRFAETAIYSKPVGNQRIEGPSIRFAEEAARALGNIDIQTPVLYDDTEKRIVGVRVTDLESNTSYSADVTIQKTVERKKVKEGQTVLSMRLNSYGDTVYLVEATDDDLLNKQNALISKAVRTGILRVLPSDIREEALETVRDTMEKGDAADPDAARKKLASAFAAIGVPPGELKKYLGHELSTCSPAELADLRKVYSSIKDGEANWGEHLKLRQAGETASEEKPQKTRSQAAKDAVKAQAKGAPKQEPQPAVDEGDGEPPADVPLVGQDEAWEAGRE